MSDGTDRDAADIEWPPLDTVIFSPAYVRLYTERRWPWPLRLLPRFRGLRDPKTILETSGEGYARSENGPQKWGTVTLHIDSKGIWYDTPRSD